VKESKIYLNSYTQEEARQAARNIAINQQSEVVIHRPNGQIRDKDLMGPIPFLPEDNLTRNQHELVIFLPY
jgi:hypothetical protein